MKPREPETPLQHVLSRHHRAVRRVLVMRHALRGAAIVCAVVTFAVLVGVAFQAGPGFAWTRLVLTAACGLVAIAAAVLGFRRAAPAFDAWLEHIESRFPELRSWLRNALDLEASPPPDTSPALAKALGAETATRLGHTPIATLTPRVQARRPLLVIGAALLVLVALALGLPGRTGRSWATLWNPEGAAPPVRLAVEPGSVKLTP
ncbi:MAG TPA: hypothetical protein VJY35_16445, partial [Candidatus Eisenbacteria bacterium]|nr:hypothetical protein [Candidatus Eisenbacteria bacterium]